MALVKNVNEIRFERLKEITQAVTANFMRSVHPIYYNERDDHDQPSLWGTCFTLEHEGAKCLVTAAHVIDQTFALYIGSSIGGPLIPIPDDARVWATSKPGNDRKKDHYDFAFWKLNQDIIDQLGEVQYIQDFQIADDRTLATGRRYLALGYPYSKNKKRDVSKHSLGRPMVQPYSCEVRESPKLAKRLGTTRGDHFFLGFEKYSKDEKGNRVSSINPHGMSGGALIDMGMIGDPNNLSADKVVDGRLAGVLIEVPEGENAIVAVKIGSVLRAIDSKVRSREI
jgi:hypothetical protein